MSPRLPARLPGLAELLATAGHDVHILFCPFVGHEQSDSYWLDYWRARGVSVHYLPRWTRIGRNPRSDEFSLVLCNWLAAGDWDVIHFHDNGGYAAAALLLRAAGRLFQDTQIVLTLHGPTRWHRQGNRQPWNPSEALQSHLEAVSVDLADAVICPSRHILDWSRTNFASSAPHIVIPNALTGESRRFGRVSASKRSVQTIVYFGRIEPRKGIDTFLEAVEQVMAAGLTNFEVLFLGKLEPPLSEVELARRTQHWACKARLVTNHTMLEAIELLRSGNCIVVLPSRVDNSPFTVYECLENGIPFIASDVGGIPELVRKEDRRRVLVSGGASEYAARLVDVLKNGAYPASLAFETRHADCDLLAVHARLIERARSSRGCMEPIDPTQVTVIAHGGAPDREMAQILRDWSDDGAEVLYAAALPGTFGEIADRTSPGTESEAAALNRLAKTAARQHLLFCHASAIPRAETLGTLLTALKRTRADAAVCGYTILGEEPIEVPVSAGPPELSITQNVYGSQLFLARKAAFLKAGGFSEDMGAGPILEWEWLNRMAASGRRIVGIPIALATVRAAPSASALTDQQGLMLRNPWIEAATERLQGFLRMGMHPDTSASAARASTQAAAPPHAAGLQDLLARRAEARARNGGVALEAVGRSKAEQSASLRRRTDGEAAAPKEQPVASATARQPSEGRDARLRKPIAATGMVPNRQTTYEVRSADDAETCDFLVTDNLVDIEDCRSLFGELAKLERHFVETGGDRPEQNRFLRIGEVLALAPQSGPAIAGTLRKALEATQEFYKLDAAIYPDRVRVINLGEGQFTLPARDLLFRGNGAGKEFAGLFCLNDDFAGGEAYFPDLDIAVIPKIGRFIATPMNANYECCVLRVKSGIERLIAFAMTATPHQMSAGLRPFFTN